MRLAGLVGVVGLNASSFDSPVAELAHTVRDPPRRRAAHAVRYARPMRSPIPDTVTALRPLPSDPETISIRVGRRTVARLPQRVVDRLALRVGEPWTAARQAAVEHAVDDVRVHRAALRLLAVRAYPVAALEARLVRRDFPAAAIQRVIADLRATGVLDDTALARDTIEL